jgi:hypothetical protein
MKMLNVKTEIKGNKLHIEVDLSERHGVSASGKSISIASTQGNKDVGKDNIKFGLNVYVPNK